MSAAACTPVPTPLSASDALSALWQGAGLDRLAPAAPAQVHLPGREPQLRSSFPVTTALQASVGAAALAAAEWGRRRGGPLQQVSVEPLDAVREASGLFRLDGRVPELWDPLSGLYRCGDGGWLRIHANFAHHRDGALRLLGLAPASERAAVAQALMRRAATDVEQAAADAGLVVAAARRFDEWDAHPHAAVVAAQPLLDLRRQGDAAAPEPARWVEGDRPLAGVRVLDLTRILAGPVAARTLAAHGAEVLMVNGPHLPNIGAIADLSRGKRSAQLDLRSGAGRDALRALVREADVFLQGYRPGALARLGFGDDELQRLRPGLVCVSLSAYGELGPWGGRRGFDSLVQTATGFNRAEAEAFGVDEPKALPLQVLDYSAGFLLAFGTVAALMRRAHEGGSWSLRVSLVRTAAWLRSLGRCSGFAEVARPELDSALQACDSGFERLEGMPHAARLSHTPPHWVLPSVPPGSHPAQWSARP
ncbi:MAG: CoA transferase [Rubrivivax sp.]